MFKWYDENNVVIAYMLQVTQMMEKKMRIVVYIWKEATTSWIKVT